MAFLDYPRFPDDIAFGSRGGPGFQTSIVRTASKAEERVSRWQEPLHTYDAKFGVRTAAQLAALRDFYMAVRGAAIGWRFKDWKDYASTPDGLTAAGGMWGARDPLPTDQECGTGDGSNAFFQLRKNYTRGALTTYRPITKPVLETVKWAIDGAAVAATHVGDGLYSLATVPGVGAIASAGFEFDVPARFGTAADQSLKASYKDTELTNLGDIPIEEIASGLATPAPFYAGGASYISLSANRTIAWPTDGRVIILDPQSAGLYVCMPTDLTNFAAGAPYFLFRNEGGSALTLCRDFLGDDITTLTGGASIEVFLGVDSGGAKKWFAI